MDKKYVKQLFCTRIFPIAYAVFCKQDKLQAKQWPLIVSCGLKHRFLPLAHHLFYPAAME
jgi:hypothetical protein